MSKKFNYSYSSPTQDERKEIENIREQYLGKSERSLKLEQLKKLDAKVKNIPTIISIVIGVVGVLIFGLGLTMVLKWSILAWGIVVMLVGMVPLALAYPVFTKTSNSLKEKYGKHIIDLSNELLNENESDKSTK